MSGATVILVSKGVQDIYITNDDSSTGSLFKLRYTRHTNFAQTPKFLSFIGQAPQPGATSVITLDNQGDLVNGRWLYGGTGSQSVISGINSPPGLIGCLPGTVFELWIGGQMIDSHTYDYLADIWAVYLAENATKQSHVNNFMVSNSTFPLNIDYTFFPLHFFFCDNDMFLPLISIKYQSVEIRIKWGPYIDQCVGPIKAYANFIYLDTKEREEFTRPMDLLITQVQRYASSDNTNIDLIVFNHPVKSIYFGYPSVGYTSTWGFDKLNMMINGVYLLEDMYAAYFHTVQGYYHSQCGNVQFGSEVFQSPLMTQYYSYNFCKDSTSYKPTGTCNFSRLDSAVMNIKNPTIYVESGKTSLSVFTIYALSYNILSIHNSTAGILFAD